MAHISEYSIVTYAVPTSGPISIGRGKQQNVRATMRKTIAWYFALALCLSGQMAMAQTDDEIFNKAVSEVAGEMQQCSNYYFMVAACTEPKDAELSAKSHETAERLDGKSIGLGRSVGISDQAYAALTKLETVELEKSMNNNCINIAVPMKRFMNFCARLADDDSSRFKEWFRCLQEKNKTCDAP
jgi:hypothetical protein